VGERRGSVSNQRQPPQQLQPQQQLEGHERIRFLVAALQDASKNAAAAMELQVTCAAVVADALRVIVDMCALSAVLQSMALDSSNQLAIARSGALQGLAVMVASGDIVQVPCDAAAAHGAAHIVQGTAAAGALWNLAAHEENKLPIAQSGVIPSLIR
jgi:hypothetical protein